MNKFYILLIPAFSLVFFASCNKNNEPENLEAFDSNSNEIVFTKEQLKEAGIEFGQIEKKLLSYDIKAKGKLTVSPEKHAFVSSMIGAQVKTIFVVKGTYVSKGQDLAKLSHPDIIELQQNYLNTKSAFEQKEKEYQRQKVLKTDNINSAKDFEETEKEYLSAQANYFGSKAKLELLHISISNLNSGIIAKEFALKSPINGYINEIFITNGAFAETNMPLFEIMDISSLLIEISVFEKDILKIKKGQRITFTLANVKHNELEANVIAIGGSVEPNANVVKVLAAFDNPDKQFIPGMFVAASIHTDEKLFDALPESGVIQINSKHFIYYTESSSHTNDITFKRAEVNIGFKEDGFIAVTVNSKIPKDARIVTNGGYFIKASALNLEE